MQPLETFGMEITRKGILIKSDKDFQKFLAIIKVDLISIFREDGYPIKIDRYKAHGDHSGKNYQKPIKDPLPINSSILLG